MPVKNPPWRSKDQNRELPSAPGAAEPRARTARVAAATRVPAAGAAAAAGARHAGARVVLGVAAAGAAAAAYMLFEAQAIECRTRDLPVPGLPSAWRGLTVLHLSDVHAGLFPTNERSLAKAVRWAETRQPDLVLLTGDILGDPGRSKACLQLLRLLRPPLGMFAVTGNHEYGLGKGPLAKARDAAALWEQVGVVLLRDSCHQLPPRDGTAMVLCGADYLTGGFELRPPEPVAPVLAVFPVLLVHEPPPPDSPLASRFPLAFAGHTHGGQLRIPGMGGLRPLHYDAPSGGPGKFDAEGQRPGVDVPAAGALSGVFSWGRGRLVVSRGVGTSFLPFRLLTRPEATIWRLV